MLTYVSLFSGAGGGDLGMDAAGYQCVAQVEIDQHCQRVLTRHWPTVPKWHDVCDVHGGELPAADVIVFGSPCQDLSIAGRRDGLGGTRSSLFYEATRIVREMRHATSNEFPRAVIWENVTGALNSNAGADFAAVLRELADTRPHLIEWCVVDARHWLPQRRRRVFVASVYDAAASVRCGLSLFHFGESCRRDTATIEQARQDIAATLGACTDGAGWATDTDRMTFVAVDDDSDTEQTAAVYRMLAMGAYADDDSASTMKQRDYKDATDLVLQYDKTDDCPLSFDSMMSGMTQVHHDETSAIKFVDRPAVMHDAARIRRLTPLECCRLMGWPDDHTTVNDGGKPLSDSARYRMAGNGIAAPAMRWVASQVAAVLNSEGNTQ
jgi:DNA (cytosine-5)-methyltransferase 1